MDLFSAKKKCPKCGYKWAGNNVDFPVPICCPNCNNKKLTTVKKGDGLYKRCDKCFTDTYYGNAEIIAEKIWTCPKCGCDCSRVIASTWY